MARDWKLSVLPTRRVLGDMGLEVGIAREPAEVDQIGKGWANSSLMLANRHGGYTVPAVETVTVRNSSSTAGRA